VTSDLTDATAPGTAIALRRRKAALAAFVGTAMEWYDYYLFGTAASLVFGRLYFSSFSPLSATLASLATFGVGFAARPLGALAFGWMGDRLGRKPALTLTVVVIGVATGLIGLLPDFAKIGVAAPVLLVLLRLTQGVAVGGEWSGAVTLAFEHADPARRNWYASLPQLGSPVGALISSAAFSMALLLPEDGFLAWGWRVPFLAAFPMLIIAVFIRNQVAESPEFEDTRRARVAPVRFPGLEVFRREPGTLLVAVMGTFLGVGGYYLLTTFVINYGVRVLGLPSALMVNAALAASALEFLVILAVGSISDRFSPARLILLGAVLCASLAFPIFSLIASRNPALVVVAMMVGIGSVASVYAVAGAWLTRLFPMEYRYSGVALAYNLAGVLAGFLPFTATALLEASGDRPWAPALLLIGVCIVTFAGAAVSLRRRQSVT
jgi:MFS family permease